MTMQAIHVSPSFLTSLSQLHPSTIPRPSITDPSQLLIRITHAGVNHVDILYALGKHQNNASGLVKPPFALGIEFAGIVEEVGSDVRGFQVGNWVWGGGVGGMAELIVVREEQVRRVPIGMGLGAAAGLGASTLPVAVGALMEGSGAGVKKGESVLVHAVGGALGCMAMQVARGMVGKEGVVIGTVGSEMKKQWVEGHEVLGRVVDKVVRYDIDEWEAEVKKATRDGQGVNVVFDTVGLVEKSIRCSAFGARIVVAGFAGLEGKMERLAMNRVLLKNIRLIGYRYGELGRRQPGEHEKIWDIMKRMLSNGVIRPVRSQKSYRGLESVREALEDLESRRVCGKAVIEIQPNAVASAKLKI